MVTIDQIIEIAGDYGDHLKSGGQNSYISMHCPWHDDRKKSLLVFEDGWYRCLSGECAAVGRNERLYEELNNPGYIRRTGPVHHLSYPPKLPTDLNEISKLAWEAHEELLAKPELKWYLTMRGVDDRIETAVLGWYKGWITVPILSEAGDVLGIYARATPPQEKITGLRFTQPGGQKPMMYVPDWNLLQRAERLGVVFGMMDALVLSSLRYPVCTTIGGSPSFDAAWLDFWRKPITIIPDKSGDDRAALDLAKDLGWRAKIFRIDYPDGIEDPADFAKEQHGRKKDLAKILAKAM